MLAICLAVSVAVTGLALSLNKGSSAQAAPAAPAPQPGSAQARADLDRMQALLNTGSVSEQAALLAPPLKFAPGSGPSSRPLTIKLRP